MTCDVGEKGICADCGQHVKAVLCYEEIADYCYGRPATQKHYYAGCPLCGEKVNKVEEIEEDVA